MRNLKHDSCTITVLANLSTAVSHILQYLQRLVNQFMTLTSMYVYDHTYTTCVVLISRLIQSFFHKTTIFCHFVRIRWQSYYKMSQI